MNTPATHSVGRTACRLGFGSVLVAVVGAASPTALDLVIAVGLSCLVVLMGVVVYGVFRRDGAFVLLGDRRVGFEFGSPRRSDLPRAGPEAITSAGGEAASAQIYLQTALVGPDDLVLYMAELGEPRVLANV